MTINPRDDASASVLRALEALRNADGGWPYYRGRRSRLEPTCWALMATGAPVASTPIAAWVNARGLLVEPGTPHPNVAFNGLAALTVAPTARGLLEGLLRGLLATRGEVLPQNPAIALDGSLQGWSWLAGTFSWVEPTAWCVLALKRHGQQGEAAARIAEAERLLRDRVCGDGGWNYGNTVVFDQALPGHVPPTAAAVLALQDQADDPVVHRAAAFLASRGPAEGSTTALALAALALEAVNHDTRRLLERLAAHVPAAVAFGNAATLGMAALALGDPARHAALRLRPRPA